jgi:hypothetical protein
LASARRKSQESLSRLLGALDGEELSTVTQAMSALRRVFTPSPSSSAEGRSHGDS